MEVKIDETTTADKMYSFNRLQISEAVTISENLNDYIVTLSDSFLIFALEKYKNTTFENGQLINELIKVMLPSSEVEDKDEWENGLTFNDKKYYAWFATTSGMKKEGFGKCETIFIREDYVPFAKWDTGTGTLYHHLKAKKDSHNVEDRYKYGTMNLSL